MTKRVSKSINGHMVFFGYLFIY